MTFLELAGRFDDLVKTDPNLSDEAAWERMKRLARQAVSLWAEIGVDLVDLEPPDFQRQSRSDSSRWMWWKHLFDSLSYMFPSRLPGGQCFISLDLPGGSNEWPRERWRLLALDFASACRLIDELTRIPIPKNDPMRQIASLSLKLRGSFGNQRFEYSRLAKKCSTQEGMAKHGRDLNHEKEQWHKLQNERKRLYSLIVEHLPSYANCLSFVSDAQEWKVDDETIDLDEADSELRYIYLEALRAMCESALKRSRERAPLTTPQSARAKQKGGRPPLTPKERKRRLEAIAEWDRAKQFMQMKVFVQDKDYSLGELNKWLNTNRKSKSRAE